MCYFFFSSRRRHTRLTCDWSSDVCSSDLDDGADLHVAANLKHVKSVKGGCEETTTGVMRLKALEKDGKLGYPIIAINNAKTKFLFDNRFGTGQSTFDGILRATSILIAGKKVVVVGYGWGGKGGAKRARGLDA